MIDQLARIDRVDSVEAGMKLSKDDEWITPDAYHRERRGARHRGVTAHEFRFGEAARRAQLKALEADIPQRAADLEKFSAEETSLLGALSRDRAVVSGGEAANWLAGRAGAGPGGGSAGGGCYCEG